jgi:hypothetical protein
LILIGHENQYQNTNVMKRTYRFLNIPAKVRSCYRVSITSNQAAKKNLLEVKTITKSPGNGIAEFVKSCNLQKKRQNSLVLKLKNDFK